MTISGNKLKCKICTVMICSYRFGNIKIHGQEKLRHAFMCSILVKPRGCWNVVFLLKEICAFPIFMMKLTESYFPSTHYFQRNPGLYSFLYNFRNDFQNNNIIYAFHPSFIYCEKIVSPTLLWCAECTVMSDNRYRNRRSKFSSF